MKITIKELTIDTPTDGGDAHEPGEAWTDADESAVAWGIVDSMEGRVAMLEQQLAAERVSLTAATDALREAYAAGLAAGEGSAKGAP